MTTYLPTAAEVAELRAAVMYRYEAGDVDVAAIDSDWVRHAVSQPDSGLIDVIDALAAAVRPPLGYVAVADRDGTATIIGPAWSTAAKAENSKARLEENCARNPSIWHGATFLIGEIQAARP